jgi:uncharacterized membrane protein YhaH (DUF805 family)
MWYIAVLKKYAVFQGRAGREEFWLFMLINIIVGLAMRVVDHVLGTTVSFGPNLGLFDGFYTIAVAVPALAATVRRFHDSNVSGWWMVGWMLLTFLIPVYEISHSNVGRTFLVVTIGVQLLSFIVGFVFLISAGTVGANRFGPPARTQPV